MSAPLGAGFLVVSAAGFGFTGSADDSVLTRATVVGRTKASLRTRFTLGASDQGRSLRIGASDGGDESRESEVGAKVAGGSTVDIFVTTPGAVAATALLAGSELAVSLLGSAALFSLTLGEAEMVFPQPTCSIKPSKARKPVRRVDRLMEGRFMRLEYP